MGVLGDSRLASGGDRPGGAAVAVPVEDDPFGRVDDVVDGSRSEQDSGLVARAEDSEHGDHCATVVDRW